VENVSFADNYYQTVPNLLSGTVSPAGRDIPNLPSTEDGKTAPGLKFPREGWRSENPDSSAPLLGEPDLSVFLGTNKITQIIMTVVLGLPRKQILLLVLLEGELYTDVF
jgi:hypothetical protein